MTRDDIIRMAQEAGIRLASPNNTIDPRNVYAHELRRFANLIAASEREACAKVCEAQRDARIETHPARVEFSDNAMSLRCAAAIRARGPQMTR